MTPCEPNAFPGRQRLEAWGLARCPMNQLQRLEPMVETLSTSFTSERPEQFTIYLDNPDVLTAYALAFAPQTYARVYDALTGILNRLPPFPTDAPLRILDLGSGIGSAGLAALDLLSERYPGNHSVTCVDWSHAALQAAREIIPGATTLKHDLRSFEPEGQYDLIVSSFAFNEAFPTPHEAEQAIRQLAAHLNPKAPSFILLLEPADRIAVPRLHLLRSQLPELPLYAPCPHRSACPMIATQDGVCHDVRRFKPERTMTLLCRHARSTVSEVKYALLAFGHANGPEAEGMNDAEFLRLVGPVNKAKGLLTCRVCMGDGALRRLEIPASVLPTERRHALLDRERGDCAWLDGPLEVRKQLEDGRIQRTADLRFTDEDDLQLEDDLDDDFTFSI